MCRLCLFEYTMIIFKDSLMKNRLYLTYLFSAFLNQLVQRWFFLLCVWIHTTVVNYICSTYSWQVQNAQMLFVLFSILQNLANLINILLVKCTYDIQISSVTLVSKYCLGPLYVLKRREKNCRVAITTLCSKHGK